MRDPRLISVADLNAILLRGDDKEILNYRRQEKAADEGKQGNSLNLITKHSSNTSTDGFQENTSMRQRYIEDLRINNIYHWVLILSLTI